MSSCLLLLLSVTLKTAEKQETHLSLR